MLKYPKKLAAIGVAGIVLAAMAVSAPAASASPPATNPPVPRVIHTVPSASVGGLPIKSLDGKVEYLPQSAGQQNTAKSNAKPAHTHGNPWPSGSTGYDVSWPNCPAHQPVLAPPGDVAVVGVNDGTPFTALPCLQEALNWSPNGVHAQYMILDSPIGFTSPHVLKYAFHGPAGDCTQTDYECQAFNWGYNAADYAVNLADPAGATSNVWWLDVEVPGPGDVNPPGQNCYAPNFWVCDSKVNSAVVIGALASLNLQHKRVGVYSTQLQWGQITNSLPLGVPTWIAGWNHPAATYCDPTNAGSYWFAAGKPWLIQSLPITDGPNGYDPDTAC